jgi:hypothetical protein
MQAPARQESFVLALYQQPAFTKDLNVSHGIGPLWRQKMAISFCSALSPSAADEYVAGFGGPLR